MTNAVERRVSAQVVAAQAPARVNEQTSSRRPTSSVPLLGYVTPPSYPCSGWWVVTRRALIEVVRCGLWAVAGPLWLVYAIGWSVARAGRSARAARQLQLTRRERRAVTAR